MKCTIYDIPAYHAFFRIKNTQINKMGYKYVLEKKLTNEQIEKLYTYNNVSIHGCHLNYSPEQKFDCIVIYDTNIYLAVDDANNKFIVSSLNYKQFINNHGCNSVKYYGYFNNKKIFYAEKLPDGKFIKY